MPSRPKGKCVYGNSPRDTQLRLNELAFFERTAIEESTRVILTSVVRRYFFFCQCLGLRPFPVSFKTLGLYLVQYCHRHGHTTRPVPGILSHLKRANRCRGGAWLTEGDKTRLDDVIAGLKRKLPTTHDVLTAIQEVGDMTSLYHYQHTTVARVAHDALLREAELTKLRVADVEWSEDANHLSKANKVGPSERMVIPDYGDTSAVAYPREYFRLMGFQERRVSAPPPPFGRSRRHPVLCPDPSSPPSGPSWFWPASCSPRRVSWPRIMLATRIARAGLRTPGGPTAAVRSSSSCTGGGSPMPTACTSVTTRAIPQPRPLP